LLDCHPGRKGVFELLDSQPEGGVLLKLTVGARRTGSRGRVRGQLGVQQICQNQGAE
jgi:hypothetical protein